jgi:hypothetical protein
MDTSLPPEKVEKKDDKKDAKKEETVEEAKKEDVPVPVEAEKEPEIASPPLATTNAAPVPEAVPVNVTADNTPVAEFIQEEEEQPPIPIEERVFNLVKGAYIRRDEMDFTYLSAFFLNTFPETKRRGAVEEFRRTFFYSETLSADAFKGTLVELSFPEAKTWEELNTYFSALRQNGIAAIQVPVLQLAVIPVYLFAKPHNIQGYYFETTHSYVVDNILEKLIALAHNNSLKVYASFPWRNHPLLNLLNGELMDDSWDPLQRRTYTNGKLDILNSGSVTHLELLLDDLVKTKIDGIIFQDDFAYALHEGFSNSTRSRFRFQTGRSIELYQFVTTSKSVKKGKVEIRSSPKLNAYLDWRTGEVRQALWEVINHLRKNEPKLVIGLEVTPGMVLNETKSKRYYSTSMSHLRGLETDFFLLKGRNFESPTESDEVSFFQAARKLKGNIGKANSLFLKLELSKATNNIIRLNRRMKHLKKMFKEEEPTKIAIGSIDRTGDWIFLR